MYIATFAISSGGTFLLGARAYLRLLTIDVIQIGAILGPSTSSG